jgi:hypothetical protein
MQKVIFLLQASGCPLGIDFHLHHFGPYQEEVARLTDQMVDLKLLEETEVPVGSGKQYNYRLSEEARRRLAEIEQTTEGQRAMESLLPYENLARLLIETDSKKLEIAATLVFFRQRERTWETAIEKTCHFKELDPQSDLVRGALELARRILPQDGEIDEPQNLP